LRNILKQRPRSSRCPKACLAAFIGTTGVPPNIGTYRNPLGSTNQSYHRYGSSFQLFTIFPMYFVYLIESLKDGRYYIGQTNNLEERLNPSYAIGCEK
jgi:hypothetical protein